MDGAGPLKNTSDTYTCEIQYAKLYGIGKFVQKNRYLFSWWLYKSIYYINTF